MLGLEGPTVVGRVLGDWARNVSMLYDRTVNHRAELAALTLNPAARLDCCWAWSCWLTPRAIPQASARFSALAVEWPEIIATARAIARPRAPRFLPCIGSAPSLHPIVVGPNPI